MRSDRARDGYVVLKLDLGDLNISDDDDKVADDKVADDKVADDEVAAEDAADADEATRIDEGLELEEGPTRLWALITDHPDVFEKHVLPKMSITCVKFFYEVNAEAREIVKRNKDLVKCEIDYKIRKHAGTLWSVKGQDGLDLTSLIAKELKQGILVRTLTSLSQVQLAYDNYRFNEPIPWNKTHRFNEEQFSSQIALTNEFEFLKWAREVKKCAWCGYTMECAAHVGNVEMLKYCVENGCPEKASVGYVGRDIRCENAIFGGHLLCLKYLVEDLKLPLVFRHCLECARDSNVEIFTYLMQRTNFEDRSSYCHAAAEGTLDFLKYVREELKTPWTKKCTRTAAERGDLEMLKYCVENGCPLDETASEFAVKFENFDCLKYLHEVCKAPLNYRCLRSAVLYMPERTRDVYTEPRMANKAIRQYLLENKCDGWRNDVESLSAP